MKTKFSVVASLLFVLSMAIVGTIYLAWLLYPLEIKWLGLEKIVDMKSADIAHNFNVLLRYLALPWKQGLAMPNFSSSEDGLHHFQQVKWLFQLAQVMLLLTLPGFIFFWRHVVRKEDGRLYRSPFVIAALLPIVFGGFGLIVGFDHFFTLFHQLLFVGDTSWLFNPATDPVIYILPSEFFLHCFLIFFVLYEMFCLCVIVGCQLGDTRRISEKT